MNDAYPAQKYLSLKHGLNYSDERINIKQHTTRGMVCCSTRADSHIFRTAKVARRTPHYLHAEHGCPVLTRSAMNP